MTRHVTTMTLDDAEHYTPAKRAEIIASYPVHEREARAKGIPTFGSGLVFPVIDEDIAVEAFKLPPHFARINGIDFGYDHPFGAASLGWDRDADILYVVACYAERHQTPIVHVPAIRPWGDWIPCAWPHDGHQHDKGKSGPELAAQYAAHGLEMLPEHATHESGGNGVEAGVTEMLDRMKTGRFKVFRHLAEWFSEKRLYHRDNGLIVKERDDILSATRYAVMMKRFAITRPAGGRSSRRGSGQPGGWMG